MNNDQFINTYNTFWLGQIDNEICYTYVLMDGIGLCMVYILCVCVYH